MPRKVYKYLTVDDATGEAWLWITDDLYKNAYGDWVPRKGGCREVGTFINPDFVPPSLFAKARNQVVEIEPIIIKEAQDA